MALGVLAGLASVAVATLVSVSADELYLPVQLGAGVLGVVFLLAPVLGTVALGVRGGHSRGFIFLAAILVAVVVVVVSLIVWVGWIVLACGPNLERCVR